MNQWQKKLSSEKLWHGPPLDFNYGKTESVGSVLMGCMSRDLQGVAQICHDDKSVWTNEKMLQMSIRCALHFLDLGLKEGDVIGVAAKNEMVLTPIMVAAFTIGLPVNAVNSGYKRSDFLHMFTITEPKVVICSADNYQDIVSVVEEIGIRSYIYVLGDVVNEYVGVKSALELLEVHPEENHFNPPALSNASTLPVLICCSSGTTGPSKGVQVSHSTMLHQSMLFGMHSGRTFFSFSTLDWMTGYLGMISCMLKNSTRITTRQPFSPKFFLRIIKQHQVDSMLTPPSTLALVLRYEGFKGDDLDSVRSWLVGGSHVAMELCVEMNAQLKNGRIETVYGSSEAGGLITSTSKNYATAGQVVRGLSMKIVNDEGELQGVNERGEVCVHCEIPFLGYYRNKEATKESFVDSWWYSGDIGFMDDHGDLHIVDRKKDIIKYLGHQVDPSEIESLIQTLPGVALVSVIGIPHPIYNDLPAAVVLKAKDAELSKDTIIELVETSLSNHKWLRGGVHFVEKMPLTNSGKILKRQLRDEIQRGVERRG